MGKLQEFIMALVITGFLVAFGQYCLEKTQECSAHGGVLVRSFIFMECVKVAQ